MMDRVCRVWLMIFGVLFILSLGLLAGAEVVYGNETVGNGSNVTGEACGFNESCSNYSVVVGGKDIVSDGFVDGVVSGTESKLGRFGVGLVGSLLVCVVAFGVFYLNFVRGNLFKGVLLAGVVVLGWLLFIGFLGVDDVVLWLKDLVS